MFSDGSYLQIFANLSESDCSQSESDQDFGDTMDSGLPEVVGPTPSSLDHQLASTVTCSQTPPHKEDAVLCLLQCD